MAIIRGIGADYYLDIIPDSTMLTISIGGGVMSAPELSLSDAIVVAATEEETGEDEIVVINKLEAVEEEEEAPVAASAAVGNCFVAVPSMPVD